MNKTYEPQYNWQLESEMVNGPVRLGLTSGSTYRVDPRRLVFLLSRYKFVAKMLQGKGSVLEVGCGDGFGSQLIKQVIDDYVGIDIDPIFVANAKENFSSFNQRNFEVHNIVQSPVFRSDGSKFDAVFSLDVLEHISKDNEGLFMRHTADCLGEDGIFIVGMPSLESQKYASGGGVGHINCKSGSDLRALVDGYYRNSFLFCMNDEVVHTGFDKMAHYVIALGVGRR